MILICRPYWGGGDSWISEISWWASRAYLPNSRQMTDSVSVKMVDDAWEVPRFLSVLHMYTCACVLYPHVLLHVNWTHTQNSLPSFWWTVRGQSFCLVNGICMSLIRWGYVEAGEMAQKLRHFAVLADVGLFPSTIADGLQQSIAPTLGICCPLMASQSTWMYIQVHRYV